MLGAVAALAALAALVGAMVLPATSAVATPRPPGVGPYVRVLLFGDNDGRQITSSTGPMVGIESALEAKGFRVDKASALPPDLSPYGQVWSVSAYAGLGPAAEARLVTFARAGGSVLLTGERSGCCATVDASDKRIIDRLVALPEGGLVLGTPEAAGASTINHLVIHDADTAPNRLTTFVPAFGGTIDTRGLEKRNFLGFSDARYATIGVWDSTDLIGSGGRVALVMDINWCEADFAAPSAPDVAVNLATFLKVPGAHAKA